MDTSPRFGLPLIMASQAHKHLVHNEALARLEPLIQPVVQDVAASTPPVEAENADCVIVDDGAVDVFEGHDASIAAWIAGAWHFFVPKPGWTVTEADTGVIYVYTASGWTPATGGAATTDIDQLGINATASQTNRLTVASDVSLFTAETHDHRIVVNKAGASDTASLLFQSGWSGRAEMGLAGSDGFSFKVSPNGSIWHTAILIDETTGRATMPNRAVAQAYLTGGTLSFPAGRVAGFDGLSIAQGGMALGAAFAAPSVGTPLSVPASGVYQIALALKAMSLGEVSVLKNETDVIATFDADLAASGARSFTGSALASLTANDQISLRFDDGATCLCAEATTFLSLVHM
ncbi:MAG: DUF2793 domain-containing protein [Pseudomonadota bacterium]